jgi:carboxyl-terminal processing protease
VPRIASEAKNNSIGKKLRMTRVVGVATLLIIVFGSGVIVGNGRMNFGRDALFHKSVSKGLPDNLDYQSVEQVYDVLRKDYDGQLDVNKLLEGMKGGLAKAAGDQHTEYLSPKEAKDFDDDLNGTFSGIGAELSKEEQAIVVIAPIAGYPAEKAGIRPRDVISEIDGQSAFDLSVTEAVGKIRGPVGTKVKLKIIRGENGNGQELELEITREQITIPSVDKQTLDGNIGYIKISRFGDDTKDLTAKAASELKAAGVKGIILDLRSNPGGLLDAAVDVSSQWLPKGKTVLEEKRGGATIRTYESKGPATLQGISTVVLIDDGSASASEITAGALKDNGAATLIGVKSYGKGSVQSLEHLENDDVLKVTVARWFTPAGKNIDKEGIEPDQKVERTTEDFKANRDPQKDAAIQFLKSK